MGTMAFQITRVLIVYSTVCSGTDQRKHQSSVSLAFVRGIHRRPANFPHKRPVTRKMSPFDGVIMSPGLNELTIAEASDFDGQKSIGVPWQVALQWSLNSFRPRQNGRRFADDTFKRIFLDENARISMKISLKFVPKGPINNIPALVQIMAWRRPGDKPLSEPMMICLLTHICVTRPQWWLID